MRAIGIYRQVKMNIAHSCERHRGGAWGVPASMQRVAGLEALACLHTVTMRACPPWHAGSVYGSSRHSCCPSAVAGVFLQPNITCTRSEQERSLESILLPRERGRKASKHPYSYICRHRVSCHQKVVLDSFVPACRPYRVCTVSYTHLTLPTKA